MSIAALLKLLDLVPNWVWALLLAGALVFGLTTEVRLADAHATIDHMTATAATDRAERERVARVDAEQVARVQFRHAEMQQENANETAKREAARLVADRKRADDDQRLRSDIRAYAAGGKEGAVDTAACKRDADRAEQLGADLDEAVHLQGEAEAFIRQRDDEVRTLLDQVRVDREALQ